MKIHATTDSRTALCGALVLDASQVSMDMGKLTCRACAPMVLVLCHNQVGLVLKLLITPEDIHDAKS